jgi:hypothetical protein
MSDSRNVEFDDGSGAVTAADLKAMRQQRDLERARAEAAETARQAAERERDEARGTAGNEVLARIVSDENAITAAITSAEAEAEAVEARIAQLNAEGSFTEAAKAHRLLARAEARLESLTQRAAWIKDQRALAEQAAEQAQRRPTNQGNGMSARQNAWIQAHPDFNRDARFTARVNAAHNLCIADGVAIDSDEYYERLDEVAGANGAGTRKAPANDDNTYANDDTPARRTAQPMPVTRRATDAGNRRDAPVRLSPEERESADNTLPDIPVDDYVENGETKPGRYRLYKLHQQRLRSEGRILT